MPPVKRCRQQRHHLLLVTSIVIKNNSCVISISMLQKYLRHRIKTLHILRAYSQLYNKCNIDSSKLLQKVNAGD